MSNGMRIDGRELPLAMQEQAAVAIASRMANARPVAGVPKRRMDTMTLQQAVRMLEKEYSRAKDLDFVHNPLTYALYKVWRKANAEM